MDVKPLTVQEKQIFSKAQDRLKQLDTNFSARNTMFNEIEQIFLLNWVNDKPDDAQAKHIKLTVSPDSRNKALGAIRLMTSTEPKYSVPYDTNDQSAKSNADKIEMAARAIMQAAGRIRQNPVHYDVVTSAVLFSEFMIGVDLTKDWLEYAKGSSKAAMVRIEKVAKQTPVMFEVFDPRTCYPEFDELGLASFFRKVTMKSGIVLDRWGDRAKAAKLNPDERNNDIQFCEYWDNVYHAAWIEGSLEPLLFVEHNLPCIPIVSQITDGSSIHANEEYKRQPFLYSAWKTKLADRQNLMLTIAYSNMFSIASNPTFNFIAQSEERQLKPDYSIPGGYNKLLQGESLTPMNKNAIDPAVIQAWEWAKNLITESTIYDQTLGQPLGSNAPYSMVALLNQAGRLPLVTIQRRGSWGLAKAMEIAFALIRDQQGSTKIRKDDGSFVDIKSADIPDDLVIECMLDIDLPMDEKQAVIMAQQATSGEHPIMGVETARKAFVKMDQSGEEDKKIMREKFVWAKFQQYIMSMLQPPQPQNHPANQLPAREPTPEEMAAMEQQMAMEQGGAQGIPAEPLSEPLPIQAEGEPVLPMGM